MIWRTLLFFFSVAVAIHVSVAKIDQKIDGPLIACDVCQQMVEALYHYADEKRQVAPYQKLGEGDVQDIIATICKSDNTNGKWIRSLDITQKRTEKGLVLEISRPGGLSKCGEECQTISKTCSMLLDEDIDADDLAVLVWKNKLSLKDAKKKICTEWANKCNRKQKIVPYPRIDEEFKIMSEKDLQMEQMMASMKEAGLGGMKMYNKDDMESMVANGEMPGMGDYDDYYGGGGDFPEL